MSPMRYVAPKHGGEVKWYQFWLESSRGTDEQSEPIGLPAHYTDEDVKAECEQWCAQFGAWHVSENFLNYGFSPIVPRPAPNGEQTE